jgi:Trk K+ transport system NAD-binding subunit
MYVVIVGVGGIGNLASFLISDVHDFTIIESNDNYVVKP